MDITTSIKHANSRVPLYERIPLDTPFSLQISPSGYCNFKCAYCWQSLPDKVLAEKFKKTFLDFELYKKAIAGCKSFNEPLKMILFAGLGEPLLHPQIDEMVAYAAQSGAAERVDILTNASLLTKDMSDRLISAGLNRLRVSLQGLTDEKYKTIGGKEIEFKQILENIKYFHSKRKETSIYVKIIDYSLDDGDEERYKELFSPISDECAVEYVSPFTREIDYTKLTDSFFGTFRNGGVPGGSKACPLPFYMIAMQADGSVTPWCTGDIATVYGYADKNSIPEIWHSENVKKFWKMQLTGREKHPVCKTCRVPEFNVREGDCLNGYERNILKKID